MRSVCNFYLWPEIKGALLNPLSEESLYTLWVIKFTLQYILFCSLTSRMKLYFQSIFPYIAIILCCFSYRTQQLSYELWYACRCRSGFDPSVHTELNMAVLWSAENSQVINSLDLSLFSYWTLLTLTPPWHWWELISWPFAVLFQYFLWSCNGSRTLTVGQMEQSCLFHNELWSQPHAMNPLWTPNKRVS